MKEGLVRGILKICAVLFSLGLLAGYVWYEQLRGGDGGWTVELDEELVEEVYFSPDKQWLKPENAAVLMPSSKGFSMPLFRKGDPRLDLFDGGSGNSNREDYPRVLMPSSKLTVFAVPRMNDWNAKNLDTEGWVEISGSNLESTLDTKHEIGSNTMGSQRTLNNQETDDEIRIREAFQGSSKSGIISFLKGNVKFMESGDIVVTTKTREAKSVPEKAKRAVMSSSKSASVLIDGKFIFLPKKNAKSSND